MDSSRIIRMQSLPNGMGVQSSNKDSINESIGRLLYFQDGEKREGVAVMVSAEHVLTQIDNVFSFQSRSFSQKDSFVFQTASGEYIPIKELFFDKTFLYDEKTESSVCDLQILQSCAILQLERPIQNLRYVGIMSIVDQQDYFTTSKSLTLPTGNNSGILQIKTFIQEKTHNSFDVETQHLFRLPSQVPIFISEIETLGGYCLYGFAQKQQNSNTKYHAFPFSRELFEDIHRWLNGHNPSFIAEFDNGRSLNSKELKDSKNMQAHSGKISSIFLLEKYYVATCSEDKQIKVWNWRTGKLRKIFKTDRACRAVFGMAEYLIGVEGNIMIVIDWKMKRVANLCAHSEDIRLACPTSKQNQGVIIVDMQNVVSFYEFDSESKNFVFRRELLRWNDIEDRISVCLNSSNERIVLSTSLSATILLINRETGFQENQFRVSNRKDGGIVCMAFHPAKEDQILISQRDGTLSVWNYITGEPLAMIDQLNSPIITIDMQSSSQMIMSDGKDLSLLSLMQQSTYSIKNCTSYHTSELNLILHIDDEFFLTTDISGKLRIWQLEHNFSICSDSPLFANVSSNNLERIIPLNIFGDSVTSSIGQASDQTNSNPIKQVDELFDEIEQGGSAQPHISNQKHSFLHMLEASQANQSTYKTSNNENQQGYYTDIKEYLNNEKLIESQIDYQDQTFSSCKFGLADRPLCESQKVQQKLDKEDGNIVEDKYNDKIVNDDEDLPHFNDVEQRLPQFCSEGQEDQKEVRSFLDKEHIFDCQKNEQQNYLYNVRQNLGDKLLYPGNSMDKKERFDSEFSLCQLEPIKDEEQSIQHYSEFFQESIDLKEGDNLKMQQLQIDNEMLNICKQWIKQDDLNTIKSFNEHENTIKAFNDPENTIKPFNDHDIRCEPIIHEKEVKIEMQEEEEKHDYLIKSKNTDQEQENQLKTFNELKNEERLRKFRHMNSVASTLSEHQFSSLHQEQNDSDFICEPMQTSTQEELINRNKEEGEDGLNKEQEQQESVELSVEDNLLVVSKKLKETLEKIESERQIVEEMKNALQVEREVSVHDMRRSQDSLLTDRRNLIEQVLIMKLQNKQILEENDHLHSEKVDIQLQVRKLREEIDNCCAEAARKNSEFQQDNDKAYAMIDELNEENEYLISENAKLERSRMELKKINCSLVSEMKTKEERIESFCQEKQRMIVEQSERMKQNAEIIVEVTRVTTQYQHLLKETEPLKEEVKTMRKQLESRTNLLEKLDQTISEQNQVQFLRDLSQNGLLISSEIQLLSHNLYEKSLKRMEEYAREQERLIRYGKKLEEQNKTLFQENQTLTKQNQNFKSELRFSKESRDKKDFLDGWDSLLSIIQNETPEQQMNKPEKKEEDNGVAGNMHKFMLVSDTNDPFIFQDAQQQQLSSVKVSEQESQSIRALEKLLEESVPYPSKQTKASVMTIDKYIQLPDKQILKQPKGSLITTHEYQTMKSLHEHQTTKSLHENQAVKPLHENLAVKPLHENQAVKPLHEHQTTKSLHDNQAVKSLHENQAVKPLYENQTMKYLNEHQTMKSLHENQAVKSLHENLAVKPFQNQTVKPLNEHKLKQEGKNIKYAHEYLSVKQTPQTNNNGSHAAPLESTKQTQVSKNTKQQNDHSNISQTFVKQTLDNSNGVSKSTLSLIHPHENQNQSIRQTTHECQNMKQRQEYQICRQKQESHIIKQKQDSKVSNKSIREKNLMLEVVQRYVNKKSGMNKQGPETCKNKDTPHSKTDKLGMVNRSASWQGRLGSVEDNLVVQQGQTTIQQASQPLSRIDKQLYQSIPTADQLQLPQLDQIDQIEQREGKKKNNINEEFSEKDKDGNHFNHSKSPSGQQSSKGLTGLQILKQMKKNISLTNFSSQVVNMAVYDGEEKDQLKTSDMISKKVETSDMIRRKVETSDLISKKVETSDMIRRKVETSDMIRKKVETSDMIHKEAETSSDKYNAPPLTPTTRFKFENEKTQTQVKQRSLIERENQSESNQSQNVLMNKINLSQFLDTQNTPTSLRTPFANNSLNVSPLANARENKLKKEEIQRQEVQKTTKQVKNSNAILKSSKPNLILPSQSIQYKISSHPSPLSDYHNRQLKFDYSQPDCNSVPHNKCISQQKYNEFQQNQLHYNAQLSNLNSTKSKINFQNVYEDSALQQNIQQKHLIRYPSLNFSEQNFM